MTTANSSPTLLLQYSTVTSSFTFYWFLLVSKVGRLQCHMESNMPFAGENITCSYSCTRRVGTWRYIVRSILISVMLRRSHVIIMANLGQADDGHEDMTMGHKGLEFCMTVGSHCCWAVRETVHGSGMCKRIYQLWLFVFGLDIPCIYCPTAWSCRTYFAFFYCFVDRVSLYNLFHMKPVRCTLLLSIFISTSLHVSGNYVPTIRRTYCIYVTMVFFTLYGWLSGLLQQTRQPPI